MKKEKILIFGVIIFAIAAVFGISYKSSPKKYIDNYNSEIAVNDSTHGGGGGKLCTDDKLVYSIKVGETIDVLKDINKYCSTNLKKYTKFYDVSGTNTYTKVVSKFSLSDSLAGGGTGSSEYSYIIKGDKVGTDTLTLKYIKPPWTIIKKSIKVEIKVNNSNKTTSKTTTTTTINTTKNNFMVRAGTGVRQLSVKNGIEGKITPIYDSASKIGLACGSSTCKVGGINVVLEPGYEFVGWSNMNNCNEILINEIKNFYFTPETTYDFLACAKKKLTSSSTDTPTVTKTCNIYADQSRGYANDYKYESNEVEGPTCGIQLNVNYAFDFCYKKEGNYYRKYYAKKGNDCKTTSDIPSGNNYCALTLYINKSNEKWIIHDGTETLETEGGGMYACKTSKCSVEYTGKTDNFIGITGTHKPKESEQTKWSEDPRSGTSSLHQIWCSYPDEKELHVMARYSDDKYAEKFGSSSGGNSGGGSYDEPTPGNDTETINSVYYAKGKEISGSSIACGDKLLISTCTLTSNPICNVESINDKAVTNTQIYKSDIVKNESDTGCFQKIERYVAEKTYYYSDKGLSKDKTEIGCGSIVTFKKEIKSSCENNSCEVEYNGKKVYIDIKYITSDKPACQNQEDGSKTCVTSKNVTGAKGEVPVSICKKDDTEDTRNKIVSCAEDYEFKYKLTNDTCKDSNSDNCYKDYLYTCSYIKRPGVNASAGAITTGGKGTINITGVPYGDIPILGYHVSSGEEPTVNSNWSTFNAVNNSFSIERTAGTYFIWSINEKRRISYPVLAKVYDADLSTTLASFKVQDENGNDINTNISSLDGTVGYTTGVKDSKYALLSNSLIADSTGGFDKLTTSYELSVTANKIALYATLTSSDASYVSGYEPRTIDLEYGRNVALIKIVNKEGKERCYTFIINRVDDRNNSNLLKNIKLSRGSIDFDPYTTNYDVKISRFTKKVSVNAELDSSTSTFIKGYEPREVEITEDRQSVVLKVISETGSIRSYVITFIRNGEDKDNVNSTYLSSLTVPGTMLGFDKETYDYTITVPYETEDIPIYAFAESETASVTVGNNTGLKVGNNLIQIEVKNNNKTRIYSLHVIRKESGLDISNSSRLGTLSIKNYNIEFSPDKLDYEVKIKREKTLLISATPESNRADIYMYGNNDLTGFSTIRVKVIAENGLTNIYSIDIQKAAYNKKIEIIASVAGVSVLLIVSLVIYLKKKNNKKKEYLEG